MPDPRPRSGHLQKCIRRLHDTTILDVKPYLASPSRESMAPQASQSPVAVELRSRLLKDDFLAQLSEDVLKSFSISEMRGKQQSGSLASRIYRVQQRILEDSNQSDSLEYNCSDEPVSPVRPLRHKKEPRKSNSSKSVTSSEISVSPCSDNHPIFAGEFDKRVKQLQVEQSQQHIAQEAHQSRVLLNNTAKCSTLAELAATCSLAGTTSLSTTLRDTKSDSDLYGMLEKLYKDRDVLRRAIAKPSSEPDSPNRLLKTQLRDNERLIQACLMALQQKRHEARDVQSFTDQYLKMCGSGKHDIPSVAPRKNSAPKVTAAIRPSTASISCRGERLVPEYAHPAIRDPIMTQASSMCAPNDLYNQASSTLFPILAQSKLRHSLRQSQKPFGEGCAYIPSKGTIVSDTNVITDNCNEQDIHYTTSTYNEQIKDTDDQCAPIFSNYTTPPITHKNAMQMHSLMFSPHAMKAFTAGSNVIKLVCPDSLVLNQNDCRYMGNVVEPLLLIGSTIINISTMHTLREQLAKCFFYEPDGLLISPMERNFVWATLCFVLYKHPDAIFIPRNGNLLQAAQFILPFDVALKPTHVLLEVSIIAPSLPLKSYAIANVAIPYFNGRAALPRATRIEAISKYQRRIYFSIDRTRFALNKAARVIATYLRRTTDTLE